MKLTTIIIDPQAETRFSRWPIYVGPSVYKRPQTTRISLHKDTISKSGLYSPRGLWKQSAAKHIQAPRRR